MPLHTTYTGLFLIFYCGYLLTYLAGWEVSKLCCKMKGGCTQPICCEGGTFSHEPPNPFSISIPGSSKQLLPELNQRGLNWKFNNDKPNLIMFEVGKSYSGDISSKSFLNIVCNLEQISLS